MTLLQLLKLLVPQLSQTLTLVSIYGSIAVALLTCFFGFRLRQVWYTLLVFCGAGLICFAVARLLLPDSLWLSLLIGVVGGLLVSAFTFRLYQMGIFVVAFCTVFAAVGELPLQPTVSILLSAALGILAGFVAAKYQHKIIIVLTAASGGWRAASLLRRCVPTMTGQTMLLIAACLIGAGLLVQLATTRKYAK